MLLSPPPPAAAAAAAAAAQNVAQAPALAQAPAPVQAQFAPLNPLPVSAAAEAASEQSNIAAAAAAAAAATAEITAAQNAQNKNAENAREADSEDKSRLFEYASQELLRVLQLEESDPLLYSTAVKRFTPNVRALYAWAKQQMPEVFKVFEENTLQPGFEAQQALRDFKESMARSQLVHNGWLGRGGADSGQGKCNSRSG